ncbi:MAG: hypothetical protein R2814_17725 [Flavobacteriaceae bacterium]
MELFFVLSRISTLLLQPPDPLHTDQGTQHIALLLKAVNTNVSPIPTQGIERDPNTFMKNDFKENSM